jgi:hypothetical protein
MPRRKVLAVVALLAAIAVPATADARSRFHPRGGLRVSGTPLMMMLHGGPRFARSRHHYRRAMAARASAGAVTQSAGIEQSRPERPGKTRAARTARAATSFNPYEEMLGYALWPREYASRFWSRGYGDVIQAAVAPAALATVGSGLVATASDADDSTQGVTVEGMCGARANQQAGQSIDRIERTLELTEPQRARLQDLRAALDDAVARGRAACREAVPRTPAERLAAMKEGLWAMRDADMLLRTPLDHFYGSLTQAQKARLDQDAVGVTQACGPAGNDLPIAQIEQSIRPTKEQRPGLDMLRWMSADLSKYLTASCPGELPASPVARLDAAGERVNALLYAAMNLDPALNGFYFQLSDEQKKKFDSLGR